MIAFLSCFLVSAANFAQETYKVKGLLSSQDESVPYATVLVKSVGDSTVVKVGMSDSLGIFNISGVNPGNYFIYASMVGMEKHNSDPFEITNSNIDLGEIIMKSDKELSTVEVRQLRPIIEVHPDKTVFNVDNTLNTTGNNGFDLLRKAPGVIIDNNNNIILEGRSGVQFYIDHKASQLSGDDLVNFLKSLQASDIDNIEIITQPSSKYDAAGNAGIINIILKRDKRQGTNGTVTGGYDYGVNHRYQGSISLNHRNKKSSIYGSYSTNQGKNWNYMYFNRTQQGMQYDQDTEITSDLNAHNGKVGADWFIHKNHTIGILATGNFYGTDSRSETVTEIYEVGASNAEQLLIANNNSTGKNYQVAGNLNYRFADTLGHELTIDADYGAYRSDQNQYQPNLYLDENGDTLFENNYRMITPTEITIITGKVDYSQHLWGGKLGVGAKYSLVSTYNVFDFYDVVSDEDVLNENLSNRFVYTENINAAYVNYARKIKQKWNFQVGIRAEHTLSEGELSSTQNTGLDNVKRSYLNFFPSGGLSYTPNMKHMWSLTFGRRIQRPNYQTLNPFVRQLDELSFRQGNPFLQPQYSNNVRVSHTFKFKFSTSFSYSYTEGFFAQVTDTLGATQNFITTKNVADEQTLNLGVSLPISIKKWWSVYLNVSGSHTSYIANDEKFNPVSRFTGNFFGSNTFLLPAGFKLEVSGWFSSPSIWGGTYLVKSLGSLDIAVEKKLMKDRMSLRLAFNDIFYTSPWKADMQYGDLYIDGSGRWESRKIAFTLSYNFGNSEIKKARDRKTGMEDEKNRTKGE